MEIYVKISLILYFLFFLVLSRDFYHAHWFYPIATDEVTIRLHVEYLISTDNILVLILYSELMKNLASLAAFNTI